MRKRAKETIVIRVAPKNVYHGGRNTGWMAMPS